MPPARAPRTTRLIALALLLAAPACREPAAEPPPAAAAGTRETLEVALAGRVFRVELALDPARRFRGLSGRASIPDDAGMLFAYPRIRELAMVMRDCPVPIDVAFLAADGRVVALHAMAPEPPRRRDEAGLAYERRLPVYTSRKPALFALELAGGSLEALGVRVGDRVVFDAEAVRARAR